LCRMLAELLGGTWINQDEFAHCGRGAKSRFLAEIAAVSQDSRIPVLIVDKINTQRMHRQGILEAIYHGGVPGDVVFVQMSHPADTPLCLRHQVQLCLSRIQARGSGHRTLFGSDPKLRSILNMTAKGIEAVGEDEICWYTACMWST